MILLHMEHEKAMNGYIYILYMIYIYYIYILFPLNMALSRPFPNDFLPSKSLIISLWWWHSWYLRRNLSLPWVTDWPIPTKKTHDFSLSQTSLGTS